MTPDRVPAPRARELISEALRPLVAEFQHVRGLTWATPADDGIRAVIGVEAMKGAQFDVRYGVCCDWVPFRSSQGYRWHRTLKGTRLDLWIDHFTPDAQPRQWIATLRGEELLRRHARKAVEQVALRAPIWWATVSDAAGVLSEGRRQAANRHDIHSPRARFVVAFTLAHLGELAAARQELSTTLSQVSPEELADLNAKLEDLATTTRG